VELGFVLLLFGYAFIGFIVITVIYSYIWVYIYTYTKIVTYIQK
jgi:hypothetical protein